MKEKIFNALKTNFAHLGLGDSLLQSYAESMALTGLVTDENMELVIKAQSANLETIQKVNDKRATDAAQKAREETLSKAKTEIDQAKAEANQAKAEANQAKAEAKQAKAEAKQAKDGVIKGENNNTLPPDEIPEWFKKIQSAQEEKYKEALAKNEELAKNLQQVKDENDSFRKSQEAAKRDSFIASEAKRLGVPAWRIEEGFVLSPDMNEEAITEYIGKVANNVKANMLPTENAGFPKFDGKVSKEEISSLADSLLNK